MRSSDELSEQRAFQILNALPGLGPMTLRRLLPRFGGDPRQILSAGARRIEAIKGIRPGLGPLIAEWKTFFDLGRDLEKMTSASAQFLSFRDAGYPRLLEEIRDPPIGIYQRGMGFLEWPSVAIVGSRRASPYGLAVAKRFAAELAGHQVCVVSGLARVIDTAAHEGALLAGGRTIAVVGTGLDLIYPPENRALCRRIESEGTVVSEYPFGRHADRRTFVLRNRIITGLCRAVIVIESAMEGGAMITARFAVEQGRMLLAVPGRIDQPMSAGCHRLIRDGAALLSGVDELLNEIKSHARPRPPQIH